MADFIRYKVKRIEGFTKHFEVEGIRWVSGAPTLYSYSSCQRRIVGGTDAKDGMYPYAAYILIASIGSCTGSLLTEEWVLTAAHCFELLSSDDSASLVEITAGAANKKSEHAQTRFGEKLVIHPNFVRSALGGYDIALVKVDKPFNMSSPNIGLVSLFSEEWPQHNQMNLNCKALGWGRLSTRGKAPDVLQHLDVVAKHGEQACPCVKRFEQKKIVCLEGEIGKGPCMGDSGGPLICNDKEVGITHIGFNKKKCDPVYHRVPKLSCGEGETIVTYIYLCPELDWIKSNVPEVPAKPASCSAVLTCSCSFCLTTILTIFFVFSINIFYSV